MINSDKYNIVSENELTEVLAHFNTEFVMSIVNNAITNRHSPTAYMINPNVVDAWETNFKQIAAYYGSSDMNERIQNLRGDTYNEIIKMICNYHGLNFTIDEVDLYTAAHYLYQVFVSNFLYYLDVFFASYIVREADAIYDAIGLGNLKKNKDTSTVYAKKVFSNPKIAIISANIDSVVNFICGSDITFDYIIRNCGLTTQESNYILSLVSDQGNFFRSHFVSVIMNDYIKPIRLNSIRFNIRNMIGDVPEDVSQMAVQSTNIIDPVV